jgi:hypothetical protein
MVAIAKHLLASSDLGLKLRLFSGASLSILDLVSDVYMIVEFFSDDATRNIAYFNLGCVLLCMCLQLYCVYHQNAKRGAKNIAIEMMYVVTAVKPGVDAARVALQGIERDDKDSAADPMTEMNTNRVTEMFAESIPAAIVQTRALILSTRRSKVAFASIVVSCLTTSFAAGTMWYDFDVNPSKRKLNPQLSGAVPDEGRTAVFVLVVLAGAVQVFAKVFATALLSISSPAVLATYMVGDSLLFLFMKFCRGDLQYWIPQCNMVFSIIVRIIAKTVVDFTGCLLFRNPLELTGAYFLFNQVTTFGSVFLAVWLFSGSNSTALNTNFLWTCAGSLIASWLVFYGLLMSKLKKTYYPSFYSPKTGCQMIKEEFTMGKDDETKFVIFDTHQATWKSIAGDVKAWSHANWGRWTEENSAWFTDEAISRVPDAYIPDEARQALNAAAVNGKRRRSSVGLAGQTIELNN